MKRTLTAMALLAMGCATAQTPDRRGADGGVDPTTSDTIDEEQDASDSQTEETTSQQERTDGSAPDSPSRSDGGEIHSVGSRDAAPTVPGAGDAAGDERSDAAGGLPLLCETCTGELTLALPQEPTLCKPVITSITIAEAETKGFPITDWLEAITGEFSAPILWRTHELPEEVMTVQIADMGVYQYVDMVARTDDPADANCVDYVRVELEADISTSQNSVSGSVRGYGEVQADAPSGLSHAWLSETNPPLYGNLDLSLGEPDHPLPDGMIAEVKVVTFDDSSREVRVGVDILGVYQAPGEPDVINLLGIAQPVDGCSVLSFPSSTPDAGACTGIQFYEDVPQAQ